MSGAIPSTTVRPGPSSTTEGPGRAGPAAPDVAMRVALRPATGVSVIAVAAVLVVALVAPGVWATDPWIPFAVGLVLGVPHGAVDHLVPWWVALRTRSTGRVLAVLVGYVALGALAFAAAHRWPVPALLGFLVASVVHFGTGETAVAALRRAGPGPRRGSAGEAVVAAAFGATTVVVPLAAWPATVRPVLLALAPGAGPLLDSGWAPWALVAVAVLDLVALGHLARTRRPGQSAELALLAALFLVVSPLVAFAVYFGAWHGLRHLMRLAATDPANVDDLARRRVARPLARLARHAALPAAAVVAALAALWTVPGLADRAATGAAAAGLALVFALTVPHLVVVAVLDRHQIRTAAPPASTTLRSPR